MFEELKCYLRELGEEVKELLDIVAPKIDALTKSFRKGARKGARALLRAILLAVIWLFKTIFTREGRQRFIPSIKNLRVKKAHLIVAASVTSAAATIIIISSAVAPTECTREAIPKISIKSVFRPESINERLSNSLSALDETKSLDKTVETFLRRWEITGASLAVMHNDSLIYAKGYGYADAEKGTKCDAQNIFRLASASKLITATAIMKLVDDKRLTLDTKVFGKEGILCDTLFLDIADRNLKLITVDHLLRHTAGFSYPHGDPAFNNGGIAKVLKKELPLTVDDMIIYATKNRLRYRPGSSSVYSNLGYIILGKVIEEVSGESYEDYVQDNILHPIGCYDMHIAHNRSRNFESNEVRYHEVKEAKPVGSYDGHKKPQMKSDGGNNVRLLSSAGGWVASPAEMLRFVASIDSNSGKKDILSSKSIKTMTQDSRREKPIGWATVHGSTWIRTGSMAGTSAIIKREYSGYTWILVTNKSPWIGFNFNNYASTTISRAISSVKSWPKRDLFTKEGVEAAKLKMQ